MTITRVGQWSRVKRMISVISVEMQKAQKLCLMRWSLKAEAVAKLHISNQDLGWRPLKPRTLEHKISKGYSENILVMTSSYFQGITAWVEGNTALAGIKRGTSHPDGGFIDVIAKVHEFGSVARNIPARPLWQPTFAETMKWTVKNNNPVTIFLDNIKKI